MPRVWRLLDHGDAPGAFNMGVDEAILATAIATGEPTLRLYGWSGTWLSLGYAQRPDARLEARCHHAGVGVVYRSTGGRAVLHGADLTYAVAAPEPLLPAGLRATYTRLSDAIAAALREIGVLAERIADPPESATEGQETGVDFDCFAVPAVDELCVAGRKLVGSAQRRGDGGVLQHGSIRLRAAPEAAREAVGFAPDVATSLAEIGCAASNRALRRACTTAFSEALGAALVAGALRPHEIRSASRRGLAPSRGVWSSQERHAATDTEAGSGITPPVSRFRIRRRGAFWRRPSARSSRPRGSSPRRARPRRPSKSTRSS
ncbi:MAG: hypothetical protein HRU01_07200 [Myxococcales bacterium]|nr:hypothetical protein [Myxococcales bacterium]